MRILDRYILKNVISTYLFILLVFIGLYFIIDIFSNLSDILKTKPPIDKLIQYYLFSLPLIIKTVSPFSLLIAALYIFGELNKNNEIISIRTSGMSMLRIAFPVIFFAFFISILVFGLQEKVLIHSQRKVENIKSKHLKEDVLNVSEEHNLAFTSGNKIFFAQRFIPKKQLLENIIIFMENDEREIVKKIIAKTITYEYGFWIGREVMEYGLDKEGNISDVPVSMPAKTIDLEEEPKELILKKSIFAQYSSLPQLKKEIKRLKKVQADNLLNNLVIDYHQKIAEPFSHLFLVIGILPLALEIKKRKVALSSLAVGFIFGFIYYCLSSFSIALGKSGVILPFLSAWLGPLFFFTVGVTGLLLIR